MADPFDLARAAIYASPVAQDVRYRTDSAPERTVRAIRCDAPAGFDQSPFGAPRRPRQLHVRASELPAPEVGAQVQVGDVVWRVATVQPLNDEGEWLLELERRS